MRNPRVAMPGYRIDRDDRAAAQLEIGDFVHDDLVPFVVARFEPAAEGVVAVVGRIASNTEMRVRYGASHTLDVSRFVTVPPPPPASVIRRRHLTLCPPVAGGPR